MTSQANSPTRCCHGQRKPRRLLVSLILGPPWEGMQHKPSWSGVRGQCSLPPGASVDGKHHHKLCRRGGAGLGRSGSSQQVLGSVWEPEGRRSVCLGGRLTIEVYSAVPVEIHISEHLIQLMIHQRLPQQSRCRLSQLCHCDSSIPVPVKLGPRQGSASPTQSRHHLHPTTVPLVRCLDAPTFTCKPSPSRSGNSPRLDPNPLSLALVPLFAEFWVFRI